LQQSDELHLLYLLADHAPVTLFFRRRLSLSPCVFALFSLNAFAFSSSSRLQEARRRLLGLFVFLPPPRLAGTISPLSLSPAGQKYPRKNRKYLFFFSPSGHFLPPFFHESAPLQQSPLRAVTPSSSLGSERKRTRGRSVSLEFYCP